MKLTMNIFRIFAIALLMGFLNSCGGGNSKTANDNASNVVPGPEMPINFVKDAKYASLEEARRQAGALIQHRIGTHPNPMAMVTSPHWTWAGFYNGKEMVHPDRLTGQWLKFEDDFTYSYGYFNEVNGTGRYHYRIDDDALIILDDNEELQPKEWQLRSNGTAIVLEGRHGFKINNGMQMKLGPNDFRPVKGNG